MILFQTRYRQVTPTDGFLKDMVGAGDQLAGNGVSP